MARAKLKESDSAQRAKWKSLFEEVWQSSPVALTAEKIAKQVNECLQEGESRDTVTAQQIYHWRSQSGEKTGRSKDSSPPRVPQSIEVANALPEASDGSVPGHPRRARWMKKKRSKS